MYRIAARGDFSYHLLVNAAGLAGHIADDPGRTPYLPFLPEALTDPYEVWMAFERHRATGEVKLRVRLIKMIALGKDKALMVVAQATGGVFESLTLFPTGDRRYLNRQREGKLLSGREQPSLPPQRGGRRMADMGLRPSGHRQRNLTRRSRVDARRRLPALRASRHHAVQRYSIPAAGVKNARNAL